MKRHPKPNIDDEEINPLDVLRDTARVAFRDQWRVVSITIALVLDVIFTVAIGYGAVHLHDISQEAQRVSCVDGNRLRSNEKALWEYVFEKIEPAHPTSLQIQAFKAFDAELDRAMKLRDCAIY